MDAHFLPLFGIKKTVMVYTQKNPDATAFETAFDTNEAVLKVMGLQVEEALACANASLVDTASQNTKMMSSAFKAGQNWHGNLNGRVLLPEANRYM